MKNPFYNIGFRTSLKIYTRDLRSIFTNYITLIIVLGLILLPSLYAWFNISACWDPYSNTKSLSVALVNKDEGLQYKDRKINTGSDVVKKLKGNQNFNWKFVSEKEAEEGVKNGNYYASITIPDGFSKNLFSVITEDTPKKAELIYSVNEKKNAIATKITDKGAAALQDEITKAFIQSASDSVFSYFNQFGNELESRKPVIENLIDSVENLDQHMNEASGKLDNAYSESVLLQKYLANIQKDIPVVSDTLDKSIVLSKSNDKNLKQLQQALSSIASDVKESQIYAESAIKSVGELLDGAQEISNSLTSMDVLQQSLISASNKLGDSIKRIDSSISGLKIIDNGLKSVSGKFALLGGSSQVKPEEMVENSISNLESIKNSLLNVQSSINSLNSNISKNKKIASEEISSLKAQLSNASQSLSSFNDRLDNNIFPSMETTLDSVAGISSNMTYILQDARNNIPLVESLMEMGNLGLDSDIKDLKFAKDKFPEVQKQIHLNSEALKKIGDNNEYDKIVSVLKRDPEEESNFLSAPIEVKENKMYPIPNYGSAMSPFYSTLAIWVGAFILLSLLSVEVKVFENGVTPTHLQQFFGRYLTILTISLFQALVVTIGNVYLLKIYAQSPFIYIAYGLYVSVIFSMIIYTLVSVFGNIGKAFAMIYMVLQVSASGGTFPIELTPSFFQFINPLLPFKYSIDGMRETVGGIIWGSLIYNAFILLIFFLLSLIIGILLKEKANKINEKFVRQFKGSGLAGE